MVDADLVSASQNINDSVRVSGYDERPFLKPISDCELKDLMDSRFPKKTADQATWATTLWGMASTSQPCVLRNRQTSWYTLTGMNNVALLG